MEKSKKSLTATPGRPSERGPGGLQHVEPLDDQHVRPPDDDAGAGHDVVGEVGVDRRADLLDAGLHVDDEPQQRPPVVRLREALALQQAAPLQLGVRQQEPVGGDQLDARRAGPAGQELAQDPGGRRLADGHGAGDPDDERRPVAGLAEERRRGGVQARDARDVEPDEPRQRQVDLLDLVEVDGVEQAGQPVQVGLRQGERGVGPQPAPRGAVELGVRARDLA